MYTPHDYCELPSDINTKIWRYIDFGKFIDLLETQSLFFCRIDKLGDQNEGILPKSTIDFWIDRVRRGLESGQSEVDLKKHISFLHTEIRRIAMVNCWHISEHENPAMWQIYAKNHFGIAIETTIKDLIDTFKLIPDKIFIGKINYCRLEDPRLNIGNTLINIFNKLNYYNFENELRAEIEDYDMPGHIAKYEVGKKLKVDLNCLIKSICISPNAPNGFKRVVELVLKDFKIDALVRPSIISDLSINH